MNANMDEYSKGYSITTLFKLYKLYILNKKKIPYDPVSSDFQRTMIYLMNP